MHDDQTPYASSGTNAQNSGPSKKVWLGIAAAAILVLVIGIVWAIVSLAHNRQAANAAAKQIAAPTVTLSMNGANPATIRIKQGQEVTWVNQDSRQHQLTADPSILAGFDSIDPLLKGDSYTFTFDTVGVFHYYDPADPKAYNGTVIVQ